MQHAHLVRCPTHSPVTRHMPHGLMDGSSHVKKDDDLLMPPEHVLQNAWCAGPVSNMHNRGCAITYVTARLLQLA